MIPFKYIKTAQKIRNFMEKNDMSQEITQRVNRSIRNHVAWSMGVGALVPIPIIDALAVGAVQLDMVRQISRLYNVPFKETEGKAIITALAGSSLSRLGAGTLSKLIPGLGSFAGGITMGVISGASTYALGQVFKHHFETGGTFLDFDTDRFKAYYDQQFEKGKKVARDIREEHDAEEQEVNTATKTPEPTQKEPETPTSTENTTPNTEMSQEDTLKKLRELAELKKMGVITEEEFATMKQRLIANF